MAGEILPGRDVLLRDYMGGTKQYMSPESAAGCIITEGALDIDAMKNHGESNLEPTILEATISGAMKVSTKSDIWSLGIILYQIVFDNFPFSTVAGGRMAKINALTDITRPVDFRDIADKQLLDTMRLVGLNRLPSLV